MLILPAWLLPVVALATFSGDAIAQSKVVGRWIVCYEHETRGVHIGMPALTVDTVRLTLRQRGDSILGEWQPMGPTGETAAVPRPVRGVLRGETVRAELDPVPGEGFFSELGREVVDFLKEHVHGIPPMTPQLELILRGDSLVGTRWSASADGAAETSRQSLRAIREKP
jgi:hypothetical protein